MLSPKIQKIIKEIAKENPDNLLGETGIIQEIRKSLIEHALEGEMDHHLGYEKHSSKGNNSGNSRNGYSQKTIKTKDGEIDINTPRDRNAEFEPKMIKKNQTRFDELDDKIIFLYGQGSSCEQIREQLHELYGVEVSKQFISDVTERVMDDVIAFRNRQLDSHYPIVFLDAIVFKARNEDNRVIKRACYIVLGINMEGKKEVLGMYLGYNEGAKFWLQVLNDLHNRGMEDVFIFCTDGLTGFPEAIEAVFPESDIQLCIVHQIRNSMKVVAGKDSKELLKDLKKIYQADTLEIAQSALNDFSNKWDSKYPSISKSWKNKWENLTQYFKFPHYIRKVIYTTNAIESLNYSLRRITKTRGVFPTEDSIYKLLFLGLQKISKKWTMPISNWKLALQQFMILFEDRMPL